MSDLLIIVGLMIDITSTLRNLLLNNFYTIVLQVIKILNNYNYLYLINIK
jgi:hypothetical protein